MSGRIVQLHRRESLQVEFHSSDSFEAQPVDIWFFTKVICRIVNVVSSRSELLQDLHQTNPKVDTYEQVMVETDRESIRKATIIARVSYIGISELL